MLIIINILIFVLLAIVGSFISKTKNQNIKDLVYNIEIGLFYSVVVLYMVGNTPYNKYAGSILLVFILIPVILSFTREIKKYKREPGLYMLICSRSYQSYIILLFICVFSPFFANYVGQLHLNLSGDAFYSWGTWASHWASRDSIQDYKFVYAQNLPIIMSSFDRLYDSTSVLSPGIVAFKIFIIQYFVMSVGRIFFIDRSISPAPVKYFASVILAGMFIVVIVKTGMFEKVQAGLPDALIGLFFFGIIINLKRITSKPIVVFLFLFGLANLKITALPYVAVIVIAILYFTFHGNPKKILIQVIAVIAACSPYIIDHVRAPGDRLANHTHNSSLDGYTSVSNAASTSRLGILSLAENEWNKEAKIGAIENRFRNAGYGGEIYITPELFFLNDKFLVFYQEFGSDVGIYLCLIAVIFLLVFWPIVGVPLLISIIIMWNYTHYGFYNLNGSFLLLLIAIFYFAVHKLDIKYPPNKYTYTFLSVLILIIIFVGTREVKGKADNSFIKIINKPKWSNDELLDIFSKSVTDSIDPAYIMLELRARYPEAIMFMPVPFNRLDGTFVKSSEIDSFNDSLMSDVALFHPRQSGSLMVENLALQMKSSFYNALPVVKIDNKMISCLGSSHGLMDEKDIGGIPRFFDLGLLCDSDSFGQYGISASCSSMEFFSPNFRSPINGQNLYTIDMRKGEANWWRFTENVDNNITLLLSSDMQKSHDLVISAINTYEIIYPDSGNSYTDNSWPTSELVKNLPEKLFIKVTTSDIGSTARIIFALTPKDNDMFVSSCGEYGEGRLCVISGKQIEKSCGVKFSE